MISNLTNEVEYRRPHAYELSMLQDAFLREGGTIEVLEGPSFKPPPMRHEPPAAIEAKPSRARREEEKPAFVDKMTLREIERAERQAMAAKARSELVERIKKLAETMTYSEVIRSTGFSRKTLYLLSSKHGFSFKATEYRGGADKRRGAIDNAHDIKLAERIREVRELDISRTQAIGQMGITSGTFNRILAKFNIEYPKRTKGPAPALFAKQAQQ